MPGSTTPLPDEAFDLGQVLVRRGLVRQEAIDECVRLQRELQQTGSTHIPRLGELLVERGHLTQQQVIDALAEQDKAILWCPRCGIRVNVKKRTNVEAYKCARCEGTLIAPPENALSVADSSIIILSREPMPAEVQQASKDASKKFGKYLLLGEIGRGAVGVVHRAWDTYLSQYVALKLIKPPSGVPTDGDAWRETRVVSLLKEARSAVRLRHPNIVTLYDVGRVKREYYISMEYLQGGTLSEVIKAARDQGQVSPFYENSKRWVHCLRDLARAVHFAHTRPSPIVHCDLKPSNVFIDNAGRGYVLDFGLAKDLKSFEREAAGTVRGTPSYMAPEQASGRVDDIDPRTDVYGIGSILYELLTGRPPFVGDLIDVLHQVVTIEPKRPSEAVSGPSTGESSSKMAQVPSALEDICLKCLRKLPEDRYQTAKEVAEALDRVLKSERTARRVKVEAAPAAEPAVAVAPIAPIGKAGWLPAAAAVIGIAIGAVIGMTWRSPESGLESVRRDVERQSASFRPDLALENYRKLSGIAAKGGAATAVELAAAEAEWIDRLQKRVIDETNRTRPVVEGLELLKATVEGLVVFAEGRGSEVGWAAVEPGQVVELAGRVLGTPTAEDQVGLGLYCLRNGMKDEARRRFESLVGTPLESAGRRLLERTK